MIPLPAHPPSTGDKTEKKNSLWCLFALLTHSHAPFLTSPHVLHTFPYLTPLTPVKCWSGERFTSCHSDRHHLLHDHRCGKRCINLEMRQVVNHTKLQRQTSVGVCDCVHTSTVTRTNLILGGILMLCAIWLWACLRILYFYLYICTVRVYIVFRNSYLPFYKPTYLNSELLTLVPFTPAFFLICYTMNCIIETCILRLLHRCQATESRAIASPPRSSTAVAGVRRKMLSPGIKTM